MTKKISLITIIISLALNIIIRAQTKVLFIGNSLTYFNDMPEMFNQLAIASNDNVFVDEETKSGATLKYLSQNKDVIDKINEQKWDYIILQSDDITAFPDMYDMEIQTIETFKNIILTNNVNTKIIYIMVWGLRDGVRIRELNGEIVFYSYQDYYKKIYDGTIYNSKQTNTIIAPVGAAWNTVINENENDKILLFAADKAHPALDGSYLMACVINQVVFLNKNENIAYYSSLTKIKAEYYQKIAVSTVFDNLELWNINYEPITSIDYNKTEMDLSCFPNPFSTEISINYISNQSEVLSVKIYNIFGKCIKNINLKNVKKEIIWDATDNKGNQIVTGTYLVVINTTKSIFSRKINYIK